MTKEITFIGFDIPDEETLVLNSRASLSDSDIILFCPNISYARYSIDYNYSYQGKTLYNKDASASIRDHISHWTKEIHNLLNSGKTVFILLTRKDDFYVYKPDDDFEEKELINNFFYFRLSNLYIHTSKGGKVLPCNELVNSLNNDFNALFDCQAYLEVKDSLKDQFIPFFLSKNRDKILGGMYEFPNSKGHLVYLPYINFESPEFTEKKRGKEYWTEKAKIKAKQLKHYLFEIDKALKAEVNKTVKPDWIANDIYDLKISKKIKSKIEKNREKIAKLETEIKIQEEELKAEETLKDLLYETSKPLENSVIEALKLLGYQAENYDDGSLELDQIIISPEGQRFIGECEGKDNKDINIDKLRQIIQSINEDFFNNETVTEKSPGILFGNPQRLIEPNKRTLDFTKKCKDAAASEKIALVKTHDLYFVAKYLKENKDTNFQKKCRKAILDQLGKIVIFPDIPNK
jgi:hypothetical protein